MEYEHRLNIRIILDETEQSNLERMTEEAKGMGEGGITPDRMLEKIVAFAVTQILGGEEASCEGGSCGSCSGSCASCSDEEDSSCGCGGNC